jgi:selenocysteine lyase/cysteine desulfurase
MARWLYTPRGCAILYVPFRNQHLVRSTIPTSHGFIKRSQEVQDVTYEPVSDGSVFAKNFETVGTVDLSPYLCARDAIRWRKEACKGENAIIEYCTALAKNAGIKVANILGTEVLDNKTGTLTDCFMANVRLPLSVSPHPIEGQNTVRAEEIGIARQWILKRMTSDANTYVIIAPYGGIWWLRLSSQIYLTIDDFERAAIILKKLCDRMGNREFLHS